LRGVPFDRDQGFVVVFGVPEFEKFAALFDAAAKPLESQDDVFERAAFASEVLRPFGIIPNTWVFERADNLFEARLFLIEVKDTPEDRGFGAPNRRSRFAANLGVQLP